MTTASLTSGVSVGRQSRLLQLALAGLLGVFIVGFVGFSHLDVVHNAAHDYRHSMAFPCH
jgi:cobalt transporter subunit CbtB